MAMPGHRRALDAAEVALPAAAVWLGLAVEELLPPSGKRDPDAESVPRHGREVAGDDDEVGGTLPAPQIDERALLGIAAVDPGEPLGLAVELVQRGGGAQRGVQIADPALDAGVG